jgi:hypothetical protein
MPNYSQQDKTFLDLSISKDILHVSGGSSAHHQEHTPVHTARASFEINKSRNIASCWL